MKIISHRRNTISLLNETHKEYGVEIDLRSRGQDLILHHDPLEAGVLFSDWLRYFKHSSIILNVKEDGLEDLIESELERYGVQDFFFLDQAMPTLINRGKMGYRKSAVRVSEYESIESALLLKNCAQWIWVDCFQKLPISAQDVSRLKSVGFKLCYVSPELQDRNERKVIKEYIEEIRGIDPDIDAVCTKFPKLWGGVH